jgi:hypothetical protein
MFYRTLAIMPGDALMTAESGAITAKAIGPARKGRCKEPLDLASDALDDYITHLVCRTARSSQFLSR